MPREAEVILCREIKAGKPSASARIPGRRSARSSAICPAILAASGGARLTRSPSVRTRCFGFTPGRVVSSALPSAARTEARGKGSSRIRRVSPSAPSSVRGVGMLPSQKPIRASARAWSPAGSRRRLTQNSRRLRLPCRPLGPGSGGSGMAMHIRLLRVFEPRNHSGRDCSPRGTKARAILAMPCQTPDRRRARHWLEARLWSDRGAGQASGSLCQALMEICKAPGPEADRLETDGDTVRLGGVTRSPPARPMSTGGSRSRALLPCAAETVRRQSRIARPRITALRASGRRCGTCCSCIWPWADAGRRQAFIARCCGWSRTSRWTGSRAIPITPRSPCGAAV